MMNSKKRTAYGKKAVSLILVLFMVFALVGCGNDSESDAKMTTEDFGTEAEVDGVQEPNQEIDEGVLLPDTTTEEVTTEEATSEEQDQNSTSNSGSYTYDVDGIIVTLRTNIDDYIVYQPQWDSYDIDLVGIAKSLGFEPRNPSESVTEQTSFKTSDGCDIYLDKLEDQNFYQICAHDQNGANRRTVNFARYDISDANKKTYWISTDEHAIYKINYEQIIVFTYIMENYVYGFGEEWMETAGFIKTDEKSSIYFIDR